MTDVCSIGCGCRGISARQPSLAAVGDPWGRLLAGAPLAAGAESLADHHRRLVPLTAGCLDAAEVGRTAAESGLLGRGGAGFPLARKLALAAESPGVAIVVVNGNEGEPASRKDQVLLTLRPHLVLDGALAAAWAIGADTIIVSVPRVRRTVVTALTAAIAERRQAGWPAGISLRVAEGPETYLAGESTAAAAHLDGRPAWPRARAVPLAAAGVAARPTVLSNTETFAHFGLIAREGAPWFRQVGTADSPGSTLVTLAGDVAHTGTVLEVLGPIRVGEALSHAGWRRPPRAVLFGGYGGTWVGGEDAWELPLDRHALRRAGVDLGCGLVAVLGPGRCGLAETARLLGWLREERSGQCGPCARGLPALAEAVDGLVDRSASRTSISRVHDLAASIVGRGLCHLPDGAAALTRSALATFTDEVAQHRRRRCHRDHEWAASPLPLPTGNGEWAESRLGG